MRWWWRWWSCLGSRWYEWKSRNGGTQALVNLKTIKSYFLVLVTLIRKPATTTFVFKTRGDSREVCSSFKIHLCWSLQSFLSVLKITCSMLFTVRHVWVWGRVFILLWHNLIMIIVITVFITNIMSRGQLNFGWIWHGFEFWLKAFESPRAILIFKSLCMHVVNCSTARSSLRNHDPGGAT